MVIQNEICQDIAKFLLEKDQLKKAKIEDYSTYCVKKKPMLSVISFHYTNTVQYLFSFFVGNSLGRDRNKGGPVEATQWKERECTRVYTSPIEIVVFIR